MSSGSANQLPTPDRIWFGSLAGISGLILVCVILVLVGGRACGNSGTELGGITAVPPTVVTKAPPQATGTDTPWLKPEQVPTDTPTVPPGVTPPTVVCVPAATFVADITIPDGSTLGPGTRFTKTWRVQNSGNCPWDKGTTVAFSSGAQMASVLSQFVPFVNPGDTVDISIDMMTPSAPGQYKGVWQLRTPDGLVLRNLTVFIIIPATPTPSPTGPPPPISLGGAFLSGIALDPVRGNLFVGGRNTNSVYVIDEQQWRVERVIPVGSLPFGVLYYNDRIYVANFGSASISVIDAVTLRVVNTLAVEKYGTEPTHLAVDMQSGAQGRVFFPLHGSGQLASVDAATASTSNWGDLTQWPTRAAGGGPYGIAAVPSVGRVYISRRDRFDLIGVNSRSPDLRTNQTYFQLEGSPYFVAADAAGNHLYVTLSASGGSPDQPNRMTVFYPTSLLPAGRSFSSASQRGNTVDTGYLGDAGGFIAVDPRDGSVWVSTNQNVQVWDQDLKNQLRVYTTANGIGPHPYGIAINPALGRVYVTDASLDQVMRINSP